MAGEDNKGKDTAVQQQQQQPDDHHQSSAFPPHRDTPDLLNKAITRLTTENTKHREELEEVRKLLRFRAGSTTEGLKTVEAVRIVLDERDDLARRFDFMKEGFLTLRALIGDGRLRDAIDYIREFLKKPEANRK